MIHPCNLILSCVILLLLMVKSNGAIVFATGAQDPLYLLNTDTGTLERIDQEIDYRSDLRISLAYNPKDHSLLAVNNYNRAPDGIERYNPSTGRFNSIYNFPDHEIPIGAIAFDSVGTLFAQRCKPWIGATGPIGILNTSSREFTQLSSDLPRLFAFDFRRTDGFLYGVTERKVLLKLDPSSGAVVSSTPLAGEEALTVGALVFLPDGKAVISFAGARLADLDVDTGLVSNSRSVEYGFWPQGLAIVPEPGLVPMIAAIAVFGVSRRRRSTGAGVK